MMYLSLSWMEGTESSLRFKERGVLSVMIVLIFNISVACQSIFKVFRTCIW